jgi:hypothetical protein
VRVVLAGVEAARGLGGGHGLGLLLAILPFLIAGRALEAWAGAQGGGSISPPHLVAMLWEFLMISAAIASGAQYLSEVHLAAKSET